MKSLKWNYIFSMLKSTMVLIFPIISFPYASRVLGVSNIGLVSYCTSIISYFSLFASLGISAYATREGAKVRDNQYELNKLSREIFLINLISTSVVYVIFLIFLFLNTFNGYVIVMLICSLSIWFTTLSIEWLYQIEEDFAYISIRSMVFQMISLILLFLTVKTRDDYVAYAVIQVFASGGSCILNLINARKYVNFFDRTLLELKKHLKPIFTIFGVSAASSIYMNLDTVMLGIIHTNYEVGLYTAAVKIVNVIKQIVSSLNVVAVSRLSNFAGSKDSEKYTSFLKINCDMIVTILIPCVFGMIMLAEYIILVFSGSDYITATFASCLLSVNAFFSVIDNLIYMQMLIPNRMDFQAFLGTLIGAITNILLNSLLIPFFSINGAAVATLISECCVFIIFVYSLKNKFNFKRLFSEIPKCLMASLAIVIICLLIRMIVSNIIIAIILSMLFSSISYFAILWVLKGSIVTMILDTFLKKYLKG